MNIKRIAALLAFSIVVVSLVALAISRNDTNYTASNKVSVVASFYPLYDFAQQVGGDKVQVSNITPAGAEPHDYEPAPQDLVKAQRAQVFVYNGGTFEPWVDKFTKDYTGVAVAASTGIALQNTTDEDGHAAKDPHFWLDPVLAEQIVRNIRDGLSKADPTNAPFYTKNAAAYIKQLQELDAAYKVALAHCTQDTVITSHEAFSYVARQYNFKTLAITGVSPDQEPSSAKMAELATLAKHKNIKYIFFESLVSPRLAATIAQEAGAQTLVFDPLEGLTEQAQQQGKNYITVQYENITALRTALACQ